MTPKASSSSKPTRASRTYKLKLSSEGIALFLDCHGRLGHLASDLLPYGLTLRVAVTLFADLPIDEQLAGLCGPQLGRFAGNQVRFVGTTPDLAELTSLVISRLATCEELDRAPATWLVFLAALCAMRSAGESKIIDAVRSMLPAIAATSSPAA